MAYFHFEDTDQRIELEILVPVLVLVVAVVVAHVVVPVVVVVVCDHCSVFPPPLLSYEVRWVSISCRFGIAPIL